MSEQLCHITSNTGDRVFTERRAVSADIIAFLSPIIAQDGGRAGDGLYIKIWRELQGPGMRESGLAAYQIAGGPVGSSAGRIPYVMGVACWDRTKSGIAWAQAQRFAALAANLAWELRQNTLDIEPAPAPWLTATLMPGILTIDHDIVEQLGDLERCLFWALEQS